MKIEKHRHREIERYRGIGTQRGGREKKDKQRRRRRNGSGRQIKRRKERGYLQCEIQELPDR